MLAYLMLRYFWDICVVGRLWSYDLVALSLSNDFSLNLIIYIKENSTNQYGYLAGCPGHYAFKKIPLMISGDTL